ncbi:Guanine nucleotide exchange factor SPIKE 1 [Capsicum baccatum]|uniref:Guanine nucleotide exchange factor SPIKE 1 n=1 Tax=Capsicum baccatum TaxID=33114 RepID=A0A2G2WXK0_CAPBA|nr:Guanine nucleotide exchange factor SPIKE 1 [Capsicum baccatum]
MLVLHILPHRKPADDMLIGSSSRSMIGDGPSSLKYSNKLSSAINHYMSEASRQEVRGTPDNGYFWQRVNSLLSSPSQPYSLREALAQALSSRIGASAQALWESLHPILWVLFVLLPTLRNLGIFPILVRKNLSAAVSLQVLEVSEKFSQTATTKRIAIDYGKIDCITSIFMNVFSQNQPLFFWKALFPVLNSVFELHGVTLMERKNDHFLKQIAFHFLRLAVFQNGNIRKRVVIGLQILIQDKMGRLRVMLTITLSELMSEVQVTQTKPDGTLEESGEAHRLQNFLEEATNEVKSSSLLVESGLLGNTVITVHKGSAENLWSWFEVKFLSESLLMALDASLEHALLISLASLITALSTTYVAAESFYKLAMAFALVPDLHIMWLLHLCEAHQEM